MPKSAVLLNGSPRGKGGTSYHLAAYLGAQLMAAGYTVNNLSVYKALKSDERRRELLAAVNGARAVAIITPLYIDCLPANVLRALELLAGARPDPPPAEHPSLMGVVNCGFLEAHHNDVALWILRRFAAETGFRWAGGLTVGGGGYFAGRALREAGALAKDMMRALELSAQALAAGRPLPPEAQELARKQRMPRWQYMLGGNAGWWILARKHGTMLRLRARPYAKR